MKNKLIILLVVLFSTLLRAQENKLSIGLLSSFDVNNFEFVSSENGSNHNYEITTSYTLGLRFQYNLKPKLIMRSGLLLSKKGYNIDYNYNFIDSRDPLIPKETSVNIQYLQIPILIGYRVVNSKKFMIIPQIGLSSKILIHNNEYSTFEDNTKRKSEFESNYLSRLIFSSDFLISFEYHIGERIFLTVEPFLSYEFNKINRKDIVTSSFIYGGIFSINYKI